MASKKTVTVRILDQEFVINTDASPERVKKVATFLNESIKEVSSKSKSSSPYKAAILAALNITEKYFDVLEQQANLKVDVAARSKKVLELLDLAGDPS